MALFALEPGAIQQMTREHALHHLQHRRDQLRLRGQQQSQWDRQPQDPLAHRDGTWITAAQKAGQISAELPPELVRYTLFARACDPVLGVLKATGQYSDEQFIELLLRTCFRGLGER